MAGKNGSKGGSGKNAMTPARAAAIQSRAMKTSGPVTADSFTARAQSAAATNVNAGIVPAGSDSK